MASIRTKLWRCAVSSVDERIQGALERVGGEVADPLWNSLVARRRRRRLQRGVLSAAAVLVVGVLFTVGVNSLMGPGDDTTHVVTADDPLTAPTAPTVGPTVSVVAEDLDGVSVETTTLSESSKGWLQHTVTLRNDGAETVHLGDFKAATSLADEQVLAATEGCTWGTLGGQGPPVSPCLAIGHRASLEPHAVHQFVITLWRDLPGMNAPTDGPFEWRLDLPTSSLPLMQSSGDTPGTLVFTYDALTQPLAGAEPDPAGPSVASGG